MALSPTQRVVGGVAVAAVAGALAVLSVRGYVAEETEDLTQRPVEADTLRALEAATGQLLAVPPDELPGRLRQAISPAARPEAPEALAAALKSLREAERWTLAAADGYGPRLIKAIYEIAEPGGPPRRMALMFQRHGDGVVLLDVSP